MFIYKHSEAKNMLEIHKLQTFYFNFNFNFN